MAMLLSGLVPVVRSAIEATTHYRGRNLWFSFLGVRLVTLYISHMPWSQLDLDFHCNITENEFCRRVCFDLHFDMSFMMLWNFTFVVFALSVLLMEIFTYQLRHSLWKGHIRQVGPVEINGNISLTEVQEHPLASNDMMINFHKQRSMLAIYMLCVLARAVIEGSFLAVLLLWHLPKVDSSPILCSTLSCPGPYQCLVRASTEKRMSIYTMASISGSIVVFSFFFMIYSCCHYVVLG
uniref:Connexin N-terminal domain-containing protein n=2 Tax=Latimeria chalumnae TaxID=7897 RepID=H2ZS38_LATCH